MPFYARHDPAAFLCARWPRCLFYAREDPAQLPIAAASPQQRRNIGATDGGNQGVALDHSGCVPEVVAYIGLDRLVSFKRYPEPMPFTYIDAFFTATLWPPYGHQGRTRDAPGIMQWCTLGRSNAAPNDACIRKHLFFFRVISPGNLPFLVYRSFFSCYIEIIS